MLINFRGEAPKEIAEASTNDSSIENIELHGAIFENIHFANVQFINANLRSATFFRCTFHNCTFKSSNLCACVFFETVFIHTTIDNCLTDCALMRQCQILSLDTVNSDEIELQ